MTEPLPDHAFEGLAQAAREADTPGTDHVVALAAFALGRVGREDLEAARAEQAKQRAEGKTPDPLGQILLRKGYLTGTQYEEILRLKPAISTDLMPALPPGAVIDHYEIISVLGQGGMGVVYRARDRNLSREVALKVLRFGGDPVLLERLKREARVLARLSHPNIVTVHGAGVAAGTPYLAMELVEGEGLADRISSLDLRDKILLLEKITRAVDYAHARGVIHRDLKPQNILVRPNGEPVLMDLGLARSIEETGALTLPGGVLGTPRYMAPEQVDSRREAVGPATDIYSLGVILYEMLTGRPPFDGGTFAEIAARVSHEEPVPPRARAENVPPDLEAVCLKALDKDPRRRYEFAGDFGEDLRRWREGRTLAARPAGVFRRLGRRLERHPGAVAVAAAAGAIIVALSGFLIPQLVAARRVAQWERARAEAREAALKELGTLWVRIALARKDFYRPNADPARVREKIAEAIRSVDLYLARHPDEPQGYFVRARGRLILDDIGGAERDLGRAVALDPGFTPAWSLLARTLIEQVTRRLYHGEVPAAALLLEEAEFALRQAAGGKEELLSPERWGLLALEDDEASTVVTRALVARYVRNDLPEARKILATAAAGSPCEEYYLWLGAWETRAERKLDWVSRAIEAMPHSARAYLDRGTARTKLGEIAAGIEDYGKAIQISPGFVLAWYNRAVAKRQAGDFASALADASRAAELSPDDAETHGLRGLLRYDLGDFAAAVHDLSRALEADPQNAVARNHRGMARYRLGDLPGAIRDYDAALAIDAAYASAYHNRGLARAAGGNLGGAVDDYTRALQVDPGLAAAYRNRAAARERLGDKEGAESDLRRARGIDAGPK